MAECKSRLHEADSGANQEHMDANEIDSKSSDGHRTPQLSARHEAENENVAFQSDIEPFLIEKDCSIDSLSPSRIRENGDFVHEKALNGNEQKIKDSLENDERGLRKDTMLSTNVNSGDGIAFSSNTDQVGQGGIHDITTSIAEKYKQLTSSPSSASIQTKRSSPQRSSRAQPTPTLEKVSLLSRGMSLFHKSPVRQDVGYSRRNDNDAISVMSEITHDVKSESKSVKTYVYDDEDALRLHLEESGLVLLKRLIEFLSECPPTVDEGKGHSVLREEREIHAREKKRHRGLTLPASAIGWLSTQILHDSENITTADRSGERTTVPRQQLECLQSLFKRVTILRVSGEAWPPPHASIPGKAAEDIARSAKKSISVNVLSRFSKDIVSTTTGGDIIDGGSCGATPSRCDDENSVSEFQRFYHEILHKPDVNMTFFPNATKVVIDGIPPHWVTNLDSLMKLDMFQMEKGCILDINRLFFPSDTKEPSTAEVNHNGTPGFAVERNEVSHLSKPNSFVYPALSKLRLSNCAIGEAAGLRRRRTSSGMSLPPPLARFPNLLSLDLSRNELFRTKTAFAGLSDLPLLSSINLSYNRLSSLDDIFMYIGNVTELILSGNEISSTRGLDRVLSLERLSLDENKIHHLSDIAGVSQMPFLMNFDLKGNPIEINDPTSCRVQVFNLFREVRCNKLPKDATFRDMQCLLPILDNEVATKDELVAITSLTYRHTVMPMDSLQSSNDEDGNALVRSVDDRSEIFVNIPDRSGHIRRIVKSSVVNLVHLRMAGPVKSAVKATGRSRIDSYAFKDDQKSFGVLFSMEELLRSVRQTVVSDSFIDHHHIIRRETLQSLSSLHSECKDVITGKNDESPTMSLFPYSLPHSLLAEADDDVWTPSKFIVPPASITWDMMDSGDNLQERDSVNGDSISGHPADAEHIESHPMIPSLEDKPENEEDNVRTESDREVGDLTSRISGLSEIWEKSYRDNVLMRQSAESNPINLAERSEYVLDLNAAEESSRYDGPPDYGPLLVFSDIDLYFDTFVFPRDSVKDGVQHRDGKAEYNMAPRIQLFKFDRDLLLNNYRQQGAIFPAEIDFRERFIGIWNVGVLACGSFARSRVPPIKVPRNGFHGDTIIRAGKEETISESRKFILCLSEAAIYFIIDDETTSPKKHPGLKRSFPSRIPPTSRFSNACWPHAVVRHPLECLLGITIGFQFQRLILRFSISNATTSSSLEFTYVILTSNKLQTISFLQKIPVPVADEYQLHGMGTVIDNDDKTFLDSLGSPRSTNEVVIHYQLLLQFWKRRERRPARRSFVLTDSRVCLIDETYFGDGSRTETEKDKGKKLGDVSLTIIDSAALSQVCEVRAANEDPRQITLVILPQNKLKRCHRWRLICNDGEGAERLVDDVRKATGMRT